MLYRYSEVFRTLIGLADISLVAGCWLLAYAIRFHTGIPVERGIPDFTLYVQALVLILPVWLVLFQKHGLYEPKRTASLLREAWTILRVTAIGVVTLVALNFFVGGYFYSRGVVGLFSVLAPTSVIALHITVRSGLRVMRRMG